jgi:hypothetical protein
MRETIWPQTLHISLNLGKPDGPVSQTGWSGFQNRMIRFPKPEGPVLADELQRLYFKFRMFRFAKPDVPVFTG